MIQYQDTLVDSLITTTLLSIGVWAFLFVVLRQFRGKLEDEYIREWPLWIATDVWVIVIFFKEFW